MRNGSEFKTSHWLIAPISITQKQEVNSCTFILSATFIKSNYKELGTQIYSIYQKNY